MRLGLSGSLDGGDHIVHSNALHAAKIHGTLAQKTWCAGRFAAQNDVPCIAGQARCSQLF